LGEKKGQKEARRKMAQDEVTVPLGIPDLRVLKTELNGRGELIITVESTKKGTHCHRCGRWISRLHGQEGWVLVRHLPVFGRPSYLRYRPKRYECEECEGRPTTTEQLEWHGPKSGYSLAMEDHLLMQLVNSTVEDVSLKEQVSYDCVLGVLERRIRAEVEWGQYSELGIVGLDEIALKKGHRDFVTLVTARMLNGRLVILGVLADHQKDTVVAFLRSIPWRLCQTIQTVCCDMWEGYTEAVRAELPAVRIVIDRFHVTKGYHTAADNLRKQELKRLKGELSAEDYQQLKGSMWAFRKKPAELKPEERRVLRRLFRDSPKLKLAYDLREQLTAIYEEPLAKPIAQRKIRSWIRRVKRSQLKCFNDFLGTLDHWWEEITNYFVDRENSGFVEGFNNRLKVLKRRCYGIFNLQHLFQRIYLDLEGYRLFAG
jgi:transposase